KIKEIISLGKSSKKREFITVDIINLVFNSLDDIIDTGPIKSLIIRTLKLTSLESENNQIFFTLMTNSKEALELSIRLNAINNVIENINSDIAVRCCEVIQSIFSEFNLNELLPYFKHSNETFTKQGVLQQIILIAFLKELIYKFWKDFIQADNRLWTNDVKIGFVERFFPTGLLVSHAYNSYIFITDEIEVKRQNDKIPSSSSTGIRKSLKRIKKFKEAAN
ncbi:5503_t:CDS:2, partial [Funneliformis mosseae]